MTRAARWLTGVAGLLLAAAFAFPLWGIQLRAPQYPEGLGLLIWVRTVTGARPTDLNNINELNHYIGMRAIDPDAIGVSRIMPWVLGALVVLALMVALLGRRRLLVAWLATFGVAALAGLVEFWLWEYDYGHHLDTEHAIITVPGMTYQPPIIGARQLLNFTAISWPATGGVLIGLALLAGVAALVISLRATRAGRAPREATALAAAAFVLLCVGHPSAAPAQQTIEVSPSGPVRTIGAAIRLAAPGAHIVVRRGVYREPLIVVDRMVAISGDGMPVVEGDGTHPLLGITADDVTVRGLRFANVGSSFVEDRAAIKAAGVHGCVIADNQVDSTFFGIYLAQVSDCRITGNVLRARGASEVASGNGIHLWNAQRILIANNHVSGFRDGVYFEFVKASRVEQNLSEQNLRYGLHFMYSDDCVYRGNDFRRNGAGVAVMYTRRVEMTDNRFEDNRSPAAYGLLLKEISDSRLTHNVFARNTTGLVADGATRLRADRNAFAANGWAVKLEASTQGASFTRNNFLGNTFDLVTNSRQPDDTLDGNYWDSYTGYDIDHDGVGDVPHHPVRLFSILAARATPALVLLRSAFVGLLDSAEQAMPAITPEMLADVHPAMRPIP
jgi:nitrous oxidase accessory protein